MTAFLSNPKAWGGGFVVLAGVTPTTSPEGRDANRVVHLEVKEDFSDSPAPARPAVPARLLQRATTYEGVQPLTVSPGETLLVWMDADSEKSGYAISVDPAEHKSLLASLRLIQKYRKAGPQGRAAQMSAMLEAKTNLCVQYVCQELWTHEGVKEQRALLAAACADISLDVRARLLASECLHRHDPDYPNGKEHVAWIRNWFKEPRGLSYPECNDLLQQLRQYAEAKDFLLVDFPLLSRYLQFEKAGKGEALCVIAWIGRVGDDYRMQPADQDAAIRFLLGQAFERADAEQSVAYLDAAVSAMGGFSLSQLQHKAAPAEEIAEAGRLLPEYEKVLADKLDVVRDDDLRRRVQLALGTIKRLIAWNNQSSGPTTPPAAKGSPAPAALAGPGTQPDAEVRFECDFPAYTGLPRLNVDGRLPLHVLEGTRVSILVHTTVPAAVDGPGPGVALRLLLPWTGKPVAPLPLTSVDASRRQWRLVTTMPDEQLDHFGSLHFNVQFTDDAGKVHTGPRDYRVTMHEDGSPRVVVTEPDRNYIAMRPGQSLVVLARASDDYGLTRVVLQFKRKGQAQGEIVLADLSARPVRQWQERFTLDVAKTFGLVPDEVPMRWRLLATDNRVPNPRTDGSDWYQLQVVSANGRPASATQPATRAEESAQVVNFTGTVQAVAEFGGGRPDAFLADRAPAFIVMIKVDSADRKHHAIQPGKVCAFAVQDPARHFGQAAQQIVGKKFTFHTFWPAKVEAGLPVVVLNVGYGTTQPDIPQIPVGPGRRITIDMTAQMNGASAEVMDSAVAVELLRQFSADLLEIAQSRTPG